MELADAIFINKADGDNLPKAREAKAAYSNALHLFPPVDSGWTAKVELCSSLEGSNIAEAWSVVEAYVAHTKANDFWIRNRKEQLKCWLNHAIESRLLRSYHEAQDERPEFIKIENQLLKGEISARRASRILVDHLD